MKTRSKLFAIVNLAIFTLTLGLGYETAHAQSRSTAPVKAGRTVADTTSEAIKNGVTSSIDQSAGLIKIPLPIAEFDPTMSHEVFEDFLNGSNATPLEKINQLAYAGGGTGQGWGYTTAYEDAWGVIEARHGTGPNSRLDFVGKSPNMFAVALGVGTGYEYQVRCNFANLSTPTNRFVTFDGFFDGDTVDPEFNRGILFRYSDDINEGRFQVVVRRAAGDETLIDTGVTPFVDTWYRLKVVVDASGTEAQFFIDSQLVASVTNLATGTTNRYTAESNNDRLTGNTPFSSRRFDYVRYRATSGRGSRL